MDHSALHMQVVVSLLLVAMADCQQSTFYIKPSNSSYCSEEVNASQCYDLYNFISGKHWLSTPNITLLFLPGEHFLELEFVIWNIEEFYMIPYMLSNDSTASINITCRSHGQTIYFQNVSFVKVDSVSFYSCGVNDDRYGALQLRSVHHSEITNSKWYESRSSAIFIQDSNTVISDCQFMRGSCSICSGGGIHAENSNVKFTGSNFFLENTVWVGNGGGLSLVESNIVLAGNLTVDYNIVASRREDYANTKGKGGGIYLKACTFKTINTSFLFCKNNIAGSGGCQYSDGGTATIAGMAVFENNACEGFLGSGGGSEFIFSDCVFTGYTVYYNNSCLSYPGGGGLNIQFGYVAIKNANFTQNSAYSGGAIQCSWNGIVELGNANFTENTADQYGGGIYTFNRCSFKFIGNVDFFTNTATDGGGVACYYLSKCTFESTAIALFSRNKATNSGGSLSVVTESSLYLFSAVKLSKNTASWAGGGIIVQDDSFLQIYGKVFIDDSHAYSHGGAIALDHSALRMEESSEITSNSAEYGGAIHAIASELHFIGNHSFENNYAQFGGGFSLSDNTMMYLYKGTHLQFISNYAHKYGGAFWVEDIPFYSCSNREIRIRRCFYQVTIVYPKTCVFNNNTAKLAGSNIYGGNIQNCVFYNFNILLPLYAQQPSTRSSMTKELFDTIFYFVNESTSSSPISSVGSSVKAVYIVFI